MNRGQVRGMLARVRGLVSEHRASPAFHHSEKNPAYLKLMMMEQALTQQLREFGATTPGSTPGTTSNPTATAALNTVQQQQKKKEMQDQIKQKQQEIADLQKAMNNPTMMAAEENTGNFLRESEIQQAQVVLAAQDMVDRVQKMLEDTTEMQFKELPALVDSIKNEVGQDQAAQFNADAAAALSGLVQNLQASKGQLEAALGVVTGQGGAPVVPGANMGAEMGAEMGADLGAEAGLDAAAADAGAELEPEPEATTPAASLGRGRR
jgi:primosomal protein N'